MRLALPCLAVAALLGLAGCTSTDDGHPSASSTSTAAGPPTAGSYTIMLMGFPTEPLQRNQTFTFTDHIEGDAVRASDHIGAHFGPVPSSAPSTTVYPSACVHTHGDLPGAYLVTCSAPSLPGTYYLRGHARITTPDNTTVNWWSAETTFTVQ